MVECVYFEAVSVKDVSSRLEWLLKCFLKEMLLESKTKTKHMDIIIIIIVFFVIYLIYSFREVNWEHLKIKQRKD